MGFQGAFKGRSSSLIGKKKKHYVTTLIGVDGGKNNRKKMQKRTLDLCCKVFLKIKF